MTIAKPFGWLDSLPGRLSTLPSATSFIACTVAPIGHLTCCAMAISGVRQPHDTLTWLARPFLACNATIPTSMWIG